MEHHNRTSHGLIHNIVESGRGTMDSFQAGYAENIKSTILYAFLCSLDRMIVILTQRCKNTPALSIKLIFFLSMHMSVDNVDKCVEHTADFKATMNDLKNQ